MHVLITDAYISSVFLDYCDSIYKYYWMLINVFLCICLWGGLLGSENSCPFKNLTHTFHIFLALTVSLSVLFSATLSCFGSRFLYPYSFLYYTFPFPLSFSTFHRFNLGISHFSDRRFYSVQPQPSVTSQPCFSTFTSVFLPLKHCTKHFFPIAYKACVCSSVHVTCLSVRSMSMPWFQGAAGLARQSPALPLREMSTFCLRRFLKASAITITPSYVSAEVYYRKRGSWKGQYIHIQ